MQDLIELVARVKKRRGSRRNEIATEQLQQVTEVQPDEFSWPAVSPAELRVPYINNRGNLVIPFSSPRKYHYWNGGQSLVDTLQEIEDRLKENRSGS